IGSAPSVLSMVRVTSARPSGGREAVPAKTTSSILPPRRLLAPCSPITEAKDLNPRRVRLFTYTRGLSSPLLMPPTACQGTLGRPAFPHLTASGRRFLRFARGRVGAPRGGKGRNPRARGA